MTDDLARLRRWEDAGGTWQILSRSPTGVIIALQSCDAGEEVDRLQSADPVLLDHIDAHERGRPTGGDGDAGSPGHGR